MSLKSRNEKTYLEGIRNKLSHHQNVLLLSHGLGFESDIHDPVELLWGLPIASVHLLAMVDLLYTGSP